MTYAELHALLQAVSDPDTEARVPFAFHHWDAPPAPPYGVYFDSSTNNFGADNIAYAVINEFIIELYVSQRSEALEGALEAVLDAAGLYWDKTASYVEDLRQFQISYEIEV